MTKALLRAFGRDAGKKHFLATWHMGRMSIGKVALKPETARRAELPAPAATARGKAAATVGTGKPHARDPRGCTEPAMLGGGRMVSDGGSWSTAKGLGLGPSSATGCCWLWGQSDAALVGPTGRRPHRLAPSTGLQRGVRHPQPQAGSSAHTHPRLGHAKGLDKPSRKYCIAALSSIPQRAICHLFFFP